MLSDAERLQIAVAALHEDDAVTVPTNGAAPDDAPQYLTVETWRQFESKALDRVPVLVDRLWPEAAFGFVAAPPKKGKTWLALSLAISVATGKPFLGQFAIPKPRPVLYVALEGHRAGLRARVGALAHGLQANPDTDELDNLHWLYKPAGLNLAEREWARLLLIAAIEMDAALVIVDVLRASAHLKENEQEAFGILRRNLQPIMDGGRSLAMLHHFGKLTETQKDRDPGERMSGTGAMFGALDVAAYITGSSDNARSLRVEFDARDIAAPERLSITLAGEGSGENGGFTYRDYAEWIPTEEVDEDDVKAPASEIAAYVRDQSGDVSAQQTRAYFEISDHTLTRRLGRLRTLGIDYISKRGKPGRLVLRDPIRAQDETVRNLLTLDQPQDPKYRSSESSELGTESHNHAGLRAVPNTPEPEPLRNSETGDLQEEDQFRSSELPTGEPDSASEHVELPALDDENAVLELSIRDGEPEPFPQAEETA